jgi:hypothetical protein
MSTSHAGVYERSRFVFGRATVRISEGITVILTSIFIGFTQFLQADFSIGCRLSHKRLLPNPLISLFDSRALVGDTECRIIKIDAPLYCIGGPRYKDL